MTFDPIYDFTFSIGTQTGLGNVNTSDQLNGEYLATQGTMTVSAGTDTGTYPLYPTTTSGVNLSPKNFFQYDNLITPNQNPTIFDVHGLLFRNASSGLELNLYSNGASSYTFYDSNSFNVTGTTFTFSEAPGGGQTYPAKYVFDVTAAPSCANDYVTIGIPANTASAGQANIVGFNNIYSNPSGTGFCPTTTPSVKFAYASGSGQVPADISISQNGTRLAYIENLPTGSSYFHVLTLGTTGSNGTSPTAAVVPGTGNNAVDQRILLSPDGGTTKQSSTTAPFVVFTTGDTNDVAYVTTYSRSGTGSGYVYKLTNIFNGSAPTIVWSAAVTAVPSGPVYESVSNKVFFTDSSGRIDYITDNSTTPTVTYSGVLASGTTSENPVVIDGTSGMVYATFNSNGTNAIVIQTPTSLKSPVTVPIGTASTTYAGPYSPDFNNAFYTGVGTPRMYIAGTGTGTLPTLYSVGFTGTRLNASDITSTALATGTADSSPVTEFYNSALAKDFLFVGVTNHCIATTGGGTAGCVMSLDITSGSPTVNASTTALAASGGTTGIVVDNNSSSSQASSIYYGTKTGGTLVKATQSGLN
ncbi:MAG: hypothetical protein M3O02_01375 [Acidobacteriota bacterium]|nr:hypothetical protein [Acidobacteriota bacterium]